jgi:hypothetical protein
MPIPRFFPCNSIVLIVATLLFPASTSEHLKYFASIRGRTGRSENREKLSCEVERHLRNSDDRTGCIRRHAPEGVLCI